MPKYMKNITLFLILFASITLQAQKVHLDSVQRKLFAINGYDREGSYTMTPPNVNLLRNIL